MTAPISSAKAISLLWLAGNALRLTILAVPPVLALVQSDLRLTGTQVGVLTSLPVVLFAIAALPGSLMIARFGALAALIFGTLLAALGGAMRGVSPNVWFLYGSTVVMGAGVAIMQPSLPPLVREWLPTRINFGSAVFTNGLLFGEIFPVALTVPFLLPLFGGSWRAGLALWSVPMVAVALAVWWYAPKTHAGETAVPVRWWPDWTDSLTWRLGFLMSGANAVYFGVNTFIPGYLAWAGRADFISVALTALNVGQIPVSALLLMFAKHTERRVWPFVAFGLIELVSLLGLAMTSEWGAVLFAAWLGFAASGVLVLCLALPALLCAKEDVGRLAAAMFTIGYGLAVVLTVLGGALWDASGDARFAFLPIAFGTLSLIFLTPTIRHELKSRNGG
ncbi:MAG TPA: MFS transporter [Pseudorhodoplanes sp.]|jgi:CP family cyanate transporter-like MFS transporter|nr:MFS transporter [Pseudorhodoplanes sp.]